MHIPIRPVEAIDAARPDYVLILPWNLKDEIIQQMRHIAAWGGKFVVPIPEVDGHRSEGAALMKVVLFCGGLGTRIREYSESIPKPMIPVGHQPILWHVMQYYSEYGHKRLRPVPRLQGQHHQGVLPELQAAGLRRLRGLGLRRQGRAARASPRRTGASR